MKVWFLASLFEASKCMCVSTVFHLKGNLTLSWSKLYIMVKIVHDKECLLHKSCTSLKVNNLYLWKSEITKMFSLLSVSVNILMEFCLNYRYIHYTEQPLQLGFMIQTLVHQTRGHELESQPGHIASVLFDHEIFSTALRPLPPIQKRTDVSYC